MIEYKEVKRKKGGILIFCKFEDLLKEFYGVSSMDEVKSHLQGKEYIIHCPFCKEEGHTKHKLYIKSDLTVGHCFVCCRDYVNVTDQVNIEYKIPDSFMNFGMGSGEFNLVKLSDPVWSLEKFTYELDDFDQDGYNYLVGRHGFMKDLYKILGIKFLDGNPVIPFFHEGEIFYYQIRFANKKSNIKYFMPPISKKPPYIIERGERYKHKIVIVEGIFDAIAALIQCPDYTPVAVLGSSISNYQIEYLRDYCGYINEIRIWMDETKISVGIADRLKQELSYPIIKIIKSDGKDPEEIMKYRISRGYPLQWIR